MTRGDRASQIRAALLPGAALLCILAGSLLRLSADAGVWGPRVWMIGLVITGMPIVWRTARGVLAGRLAADLVAALAIGGAVAFDQPLAGLVIVVMQSGGEALEAYAAGRASAAVQALEQESPRWAHRVRDGEVEDLSADAVSVGDTLLVRPGDMVPCDAVVLEGRSQVDTSRLTGEPLPVTAEPGSRLSSGSVNGASPLTVRVTAVAWESQYARIVDLVRKAQASKAPLQRLADRYAVWFTPATLAVCLLAYGITHDPIRVLAVLVVATPCPLILAAPVAIIGGINRAARRQIIIRSGAALEQLAGITVAVFDKTGTLTVGRPRVQRVAPAAPLTAAEVLRLAAAIEQGSGHLLARTVVDAAEAIAHPLPSAEHVEEVPGRGVTGDVEGHALAVGSRSFVGERYPSAAAGLDDLDPPNDGLRAYVTVDGRAAGVIEFADAARPGLPAVFADLKALGITRTLLLSGDQERYTQAIAEAVGIREAKGNLMPGDKVRVIQGLVNGGLSVLMVGDGTNDAPAMSSATVGVALAGHGGGITAEAADVVLLVDDVSRVVDVLRIGRETIRIARQSIWTGLGLSAVAMVFAAMGAIPPAVGAVLQELVDVAVILNALRASR